MVCVTGRREAWGQGQWAGRERPDSAVGARKQRGGSVGCCGAEPEKRW